jgi:DNA-binding transcriptional regulator YbjK
VTHRAVSARAGLPPAAAGYYFTTSQELIEQALRFHVEQWSASLSKVLDSAAESAKSVRQFEERVVRALLAGDSGVNVAVYEVYLEAARNPALREVVQESMSSFEDVVAGHLDRLGVRDPRGAAISLVAIVDGFVLHQMANPRPHEEHVEAMVVTMSGMLLAHRLDRDELDRRIDDFSR